MVDEIECVSESVIGGEVEMEGRERGSPRPLPSEISAEKSRYVGINIALRRSTTLIKEQK